MRAAEKHTRLRQAAHVIQRGGGLNQSVAEAFGWSVPSDVVDALPGPPNQRGLYDNARCRDEVSEAVRECAEQFKEPDDE